MTINLSEPHPVVTLVPPEMLTKELRVATTAATADLTPTSGKRIRVLCIMLSSTVTSALTSTLRSTLAFGTGHTTDADKILASYRSTKDANLNPMCIGGMNCLGAVDEVVRLTNTTFSSGGVITRVIIYYREE